MRILFRAVRTAFRAAGRVIAEVNTRVLLALFFVLVIMPIGLLFRLTRRSPLHADNIGAWMPADEASGPERPF